MALPCFCWGCKNVAPTQCAQLGRATLLTVLRSDYSTNGMHTYLSLLDLIAFLFKGELYRISPWVKSGVNSDQSVAESLESDVTLEAMFSNLGRQPTGETTSKERSKKGWTPDQPLCPQGSEIAGLFASLFTVAL